MMEQHKQGFQQHRTAFGDPVFWQDGKLHGVTQFDYAALDGEGESPQDAHVANVRDVFAAVLRWVWISGNGRPRNVKSATLRFVALSCAVFPGLLNDASYLKLGELWDCGKANISFLVRDFEKRFSFKVSRTRPATARARMAEAMRGNQNRTKARKVQA